MSRKAISAVSHMEELFFIFDDGTVWELFYNDDFERDWRQINLPAAWIEKVANRDWAEGL